MLLTWKKARCWHKMLILISYICDDSTPPSNQLMKDNVERERNSKHLHICLSVGQIVQICRLVYCILSTKRKSSGLAFGRRPLHTPSGFGQSNVRFIVVLLSLSIQIRTHPFIQDGLPATPLLTGHSRSLPHLIRRFLASTDERVSLNNITVCSGPMMTHAKNEEGSWTRPASYLTRLLFTGMMMMMMISKKGSVWWMFTGDSGQSRLLWRWKALWQ
jgi:hypothetical protein